MAKQPPKKQKQKAPKVQDTGTSAPTSGTKPTKGKAPASTPATGNKPTKSQTTERPQSRGKKP